MHKVNIYIDVEELRWRIREESQEEIESRSDWRKDMLEGVEREKERSDKQVGMEDRCWGTLGN